MVGRGVCTEITSRSITPSVSMIFVSAVNYGYIWLIHLNEQAQTRLELIIEQMKATEGVTEGMKQQDQMAWVGAHF